MASWQNFYLQKMGTENGALYPTYESVSEWGVWCKEFTWKLYGNVKEPAVRSWNDEHGTDEYIGADGLWLDAYDLEVEFGCKAMSNDVKEVNNVRVAVSHFLEYLRSSGMLMLFSSWSRVGRQYVRFKGVSDDATWEPDMINKLDDENRADENTTTEFLVFKVTFKVNDPKTDITLHMSGNNKWLGLAGNNDVWLRD